MKVKVEEKKPCKKFLSIQYPIDKLKEDHQKVLQEYQQKASIPGFRIGKAPVQVVEKHFFQDIKSEVLKRLLPKICAEVFEKEKISIVSDPSVQKVEYDLQKGLSFDAEVDVAPVVELPEYKKIKLIKDDVEVKEDEIEQAIQQMREQHAVYHPIAGRPLQYEDYAVIDYVTIGSKAKKEERKGILILIKKDDPSGMNDQLVGMNAGETRKVESKEQDGGSKISFQIKLSEIKEKKLPELNEDFLKEINEKSFEDLKSKIKENIKNYKENASKESLRNKVMRMLSEKAEFEVPESLVHREAQRMYTEIMYKVRQGVVSSKSLEDQKVLQDIENESRRRVRAGYILNEIAKKEKIIITDDLMNDEIKKLAQRMNKTPEEIRSEIEKNDRLEIMRVRLEQDKVVEFVISHAIIK